MDNLVLNVNLRKITGKKTSSLRDNGVIPAVIYGKGMENINIEVNTLDFEKILKEAAFSTLVELKVDGKDSYKVLIKEVKYDNLLRGIEHIDFFKIDEKSKVQVDVDLNFINESSYMKEYGGMLVKNFNSVKIECYPKDLIRYIDVDLSTIKGADDHIRIKDLKTADDARFINHGEEIVASVIVKGKKVEAAPAAPEAKEKNSLYIKKENNLFFKLFSFFLIIY